MLMVSIASGEEVLETIGRRLADQGVADGAIVSLVGMVVECAVSTMSKDDESDVIVTQYAQPLELAGVGEIKDGTVHIHVSLGAEGNHSIAGHLEWATAGSCSTNAYILPMD